MYIDVIVQAFISLSLLFPRVFDYAFKYQLILLTRPTGREYRRE